ncbi:MAG: hypothetical protein ACRC8S_22230 [Fimbriiglobus sp.]
MALETDFTRITLKEVLFYGGNVVMILGMASPWVSAYTGSQRANKRKLYEGE